MMYLVGLCPRWPIGVGMARSKLAIDIRITIERSAQTIVDGVDGLVHAAYSLIVACNPAGALNACQQSARVDTLLRQHDSGKVSI